MAKSQKLPKKDVLERVRFAATSGQYRVLPHARQRCTERNVPLPDLEYLLETGHHAPRRDRYDESHASWTYCFEGKTIDDTILRVIVAFDGQLLIVTVVKLSS